MAEAGPNLSGNLDFTGQVVLVTGGARGVGRGITDGFAAAGATVFVCGRRPPSESGPADALAAGGMPDGVMPNSVGFEPAPGALPAEFIAADVRDPEQVQALVDTIVRRAGRIDVVVNNAGGSPPAESASASARFSTAIVALNLLAPLFVSQSANAVMQQQEGGGVILNIASVSGLRPSPSTAAYGAAKAGLINLTATLAVEWAPKVRVNAITVGLVRTDQAHLWYGDEAGVAAVGATVPLGRMAEPADVADVCLMLASPLARYVTGANLVVHGGGEKPAYIAASNSPGRG